MNEPEGPHGMTAKQAKILELGIIAFCIVALIMIFQPFSMTVFSIGAAFVVVGGLAFNLVPLCKPGAPLKSVLRAGVIVLAVLTVVIFLAMGSTELYSIYLQESR